MNSTKKIIIILILAACSIASAIESSQMNLPKSGAVILTRHDGADSRRYDFFWEGSDQNSVLIYSHSATSSRSEWCSLLACDETDASILALVELSEIVIMFINYDKKEETATAQRGSASMFREFATGHMGKRRLSLASPNRVTVEIPEQDTQSWSIIDGMLVDDNGEKYLGLFGSGSGDRNYPAPRDTPNLEGKGNGEVADDAPSPSREKTGSKSIVASEDSGSSIPWLVVLGATAAALGLFWFLLTGHRRRQSR